MSDSTNIETTILNALAEICGANEVINFPETDLFVTGLLDSFGIVELLLLIQEQLGINIAPTEIEREQWSTPAKIIRYLEEKQNRG